MCTFVRIGLYICKWFVPRCPSLDDAGQYVFKGEQPVDVVDALCEALWDYSMLEEVKIEALTTLHIDALNTHGRCWYIALQVIAQLFKYRYRCEVREKYYNAVHV